MVDLNLVKWFPGDCENDARSRLLPHSLSCRAKNEFSASIHFSPLFFIQSFDGWSTIRDLYIEARAKHNKLNNEESGREARSFSLVSAL